MAKLCSRCEQILHWPAIYSCFYCKKVYCDKHRLAENHECPKVMAAKHIEKDYLRRKGVNVTTGRYAAVCKQCGFRTVHLDIEEANQLRIQHIKSRGCDSSSVQLSEHDEDRAADETLSKKQSAEDSTPSQVGGKVPDWMQICLSTAKGVLKTHHGYCNCDTESFFRASTFDLYIQDDRQNAYAYINIMGESNHFSIGIHPVFLENTPYNQRALVVTLTHELLHALHRDWGHDRINPQEKLLANKAGFFDALVELERMGVSGKMRFCDR